MAAMPVVIDRYNDMEGGVGEEEEEVGGRGGVGKKGES
jgi:hypothetical protein